MPITSGWYNEANAIYIHRFAGKWLWQDFAQRVHEVHPLMDARDGKVDFIIDIAATNYLPPDMFRGIRQMARYKHPKVGLNVWVTNTLLRTFGNMFERVYPQREWNTTYVSSVDAALEAIRQWRTDPAHRADYTVQL